MRKRAVAEQWRRGARGARMERRRTQNPSARREGETMEVNCQMSPGLISKVSDDLVSSENGVTTVEKLRKYKYNPFLVYFTNLMIPQST